MKNKFSLLHKTLDKELDIQRNDKEFDELIKDLNVKELIDIMCYDIFENKDYDAKRRIITSVLASLDCSIEDIQYRQMVLIDFLNMPYLLSALISIFNKYEALEEKRSFSINVSKQKIEGESKLLNAIKIFLEYLDILSRMDELFYGFHDKFKSEGLKELSNIISNYIKSDDYKELNELLEGLIKPLQRNGNMRFIVKRNSAFKLTEAALVEIREKNFYEGTYENANIKNIIELNIKNGLKKIISKIPNDKKNYSASPIINLQLTENAMEIREKALNHICNIISTITSSIASFIRNLKNDLLFFEGAVKLVQKLCEFGLPLCVPEIVGTEERVFEVKDTYDLSFTLLLSKNMEHMNSIITNDVFMNNKGRMLIITGPNQGGKTTYIRSLGIVQVLAQAGILVPASSAKISPVDRIYSHFPVEERPDGNTGRLGEELKRFADIIKVVTPKSLVLMNESFASTNSIEGTKIAEDILKGLSIIGTRTVFVTHLYELAERVDIINEELKDKSREYNKFMSLTAGIEESENKITDSQERNTIRKRTYKILPGIPAKSSFADDIAKQYGIGYNQLLEVMHLKEN